MGIKVRKDGEWVTVATASLGTGTTKVALIEHREDSSVGDLPAFTQNTWVIRELNHKTDPQSMVSLDSGHEKFSLPSGTYRIKWGAPAVRCDRHQSKLVYATNSSFTSPTFVYGSSEIIENGANLVGTRSLGETVLTLTTTTWFRIEQIVDGPATGSAASSKGFNTAASFSGVTAPPTYSIYTQVAIEDLTTAAGAGGGGGGVTDGVKGNITVSNSGTTWTINNEVIEEKHINADGSPSNGKVLEYYSGHSTNWRWADPGATVTTSDSAPASPVDGDLWWNSTTGILNVYYTDADSSQWVNATGRTGHSGTDIPVGGIIMYSGTDTELNALTNWKLCDGTTYGSVTTPNLKDKFVIGADQYSSGWKTNVTGSLTPDGGSKDAVVVQHNHTYVTKGDTYIGDSDIAPTDTWRLDSTVNTGDSGESGTNKNLPPYYALAYIMRIS